MPVNWLVRLLYFKGSVRLTLFGVSGRPEILMRWRDVNATGILLVREARPCSCCRSPEQCASALRFQKHERHYQIDSLPRAGWVAVPGGHSLVFSDSELIKARGDRKAMLSLHFGEGGINKGLTAATQLSKPREESSRLLLREVAWRFPGRGCVFHQLFFYWSGLPSLNLCPKDDTSVKIYHRSSCGEICKSKTNGLFAPWPQSPDPTDSPLSRPRMRIDVLNNLLEKRTGRMGFSCLLGTPE